MSIELKRPVVLLMLATTFFITLTYLGTLIWTSRGLTGAVDEVLTGYLLLGGGLAGAVAGALLGRMISKGGYKFSILLGIVTLFTSIFMFIFLGDITTPDAIPIVGIALVLVGWAGGILFPLMIAFSQVISPERRGVLAGAVTFSSFFGAALIPSVYEPLFHVSMTSVYWGILGAALLLLAFISILYRKAELSAYA